MTLQERKLEIEAQMREIEREFAATNNTQKQLADAYQQRVGALQLLSELIEERESGCNT